jgi:hypothetical protein
LLSVAACSGGSTPATTASSPKSASTTLAASGDTSDAPACQAFHAGAADFANNLRSAADVASLVAAYGGFVPVVEEDQYGTEGTPLFALFDTLASALQAQADAEGGGNNPSNARVVAAEKTVFNYCRSVDPTENWSTS